MSTLSQSPAALECPICLERWLEPKILTKCGHSVCDKCTQTMFTEGKQCTTLSCPLCRVRTIVPYDGLPTNFALVDLVNEFLTRNRNISNNTIHCSWCDRRMSNSDENVCATCRHAVCNHYDTTTTPNNDNNNTVVQQQQQQQQLHSFKEIWNQRHAIAELRAQLNQSDSEDDWT